MEFFYSIRDFFVNAPPPQVSASLKELWDMISTVVYKTRWFLLPVYLWIAYWFWLFFRRDKYMREMPWVYIAISVPPESEVNPHAMEQVFAGLYGIKSPPNFVECYWLGEQQLSISFEMVGINGHVRFIIGTPTKYRDLVEANIYAYYPDAEITEVEDYTKYLPNYFPNEKYNMFGMEFILAKKDAYPIRTYRAFADEWSRVRFLDPVATLAELMSGLNEGEQMWLQWVIRPADDKWKKEGEKVIAKHIHMKLESKEDFVQKRIFPGIHGAHKAVEDWMGVPEADPSDKRPEPISWMMHLPPSEKNVIEAIGENIAKIGFQVKCRYVYIARKEKFDKAHGIYSILGAMQLFSTQDLNGFKKLKKMTTKVDYFRFRIPWRQKRLMRYYKARACGAGASPFVFNIEELATVFHFPFVTVRAPMMVKTESKRSGPPTNLPIQ